MDEKRANPLAKKAQEFIRSHGLEDDVQVDDVEASLIRESFSETDNGVWVKAWVFVPNERP